MEKSNFDSEKYRDNLAKDLKEIRKDSPKNAQEVLEDEQGTKEYYEAKKNHLSKDKGNNKQGTLASIMSRELSKFLKIKEYEKIAEEKLEKMPKEIIVSKESLGRAVRILHNRYDVNDFDLHQKTFMSNYKLINDNNIILIIDREQEERSNLNSYSSITRATHFSNKIVIVDKNLQEIFSTDYFYCGKTKTISGDSSNRRATWNSDGPIEVVSPEMSVDDLKFLDVIGLSESRSNILLRNATGNIVSVPIPENLFETV